MSIAVIYGSTTGNLESSAKYIAEKLGIENIHNIADTDAETINSYDKLICGSSTWGDGDLQDDWDSFDFSKLKLEGKTIAVFGIGDGESYEDTFCNAMGILAQSLKTQGATLVGEVSTEGYVFKESKSIIDGKFVGLALDDDNQGDLTTSRIDSWVEQIRPYFS